MLNKIISSFTIIPEAFVYLVSRPSLYWLIITPLILNIIFAVFAFTTIFALFQNFTDQFISYIEVEGVLFNLIYGAGSILSSVIAFVATWFVINTIGIIIQSPFNGQIVERILDEKNVVGFKDYKGLEMVVFELTRSIKFEVVKLILISLTFILTFLLNFIPVVGSLLYFAINTANLFFLNLMDLLDPSYSRIGKTVKQEVKLTFKNISNFVGFGILAYAVWAIPIINFLLMPLLYVAATLTFVRLKASDNL